MQKQKVVTVVLNDSGEHVLEELTLLGDRSTISSARILRDTGEMIAPVTIARTGVMLYKAKELGGLFADRDPESIVRVMTKPEVLFDSATIEACRSIPLTVEHPADDVNIGNNKTLQKGFLEGVPYADGSALAGHVVINDSGAINLVDSGIDQISLGHKSKLVRVDDNADYDCEKTTIVPNHIAIVRRGRAQTTRIGDSGEEISIVDADVHAVTVAERDAALEKVSTLEAKLADAQAAVLSEADVTKLVEERAKARLDLLTQVATLGDSMKALDFTGKTESEIKRMVVCALSDKDLSDKSDIYIDTRFEIALEDSDENIVNLSDALSKSLQTPEEKTEKKPSVAEEALARRNARYAK